MKNVIRYLLLIACTMALPLNAAEPTMQAVLIRDFGGPDVLELTQQPLPQAGPGQVRIRVHAAGVNPFDWKQREGRNRPGDGPPPAPGGDVAGVIDQIGADVSGWAVGDEVIAALHRSGQGGYAQYAVARVDDIARKPERLSFNEAAGMPTVAWTAWVYLVELAQVKPGDKVLVTGAAGGVGSMVVQLARAHGAVVVGTASPRNHAWLRELGASEVIDYHSERFEQRVQDADIVFDTVGGDTLVRAPAAVRRGGTLVAIAGRANADACAERGIRCPAPAQPGELAFGQRLHEMAELAAAGRLQINIDKVFPLSEAAAAQAYVELGHTRGKVVLEVP